MAKIDWDKEICDNIVELTRLYTPTLKPGDVLPNGEVVTEQPETVLEEAERLVAKDRGRTYSHPYEDFTRVQGMAQALWGRGPENAAEHALYCILIKLARLAVTPGHRDSIVDIAGYARTYELVIDSQIEQIVT